MLAFERQLVGMVTKMGPVDRSPVLLVVQAAARLAAAVLLRVLQVFSLLLLQVKGGHSDETVAVAASLGQNRRSNSLEHLAVTAACLLLSRCAAPVLLAAVSVSGWRSY